jgi:hypothetical protein
MAANAQRQPRDVVEFAPNTPVTLALKYAQGKTISGQYGERMMYSLTDGKIMFLDLPVAGQIEKLNINVRESFTITKRTDGKKDSPVSWEVARPIVAGEQPNGTFAVPKLPDPKPAQRASSPVPTPSTRLVEDCNLLVDAYAAVLEHALTTHNGRVKPDEVKSIFLTTVINLTGGKTRAA